MTPATPGAGDPAPAGSARGAAPSSPGARSLLADEPRVINVGLELFAETLAALRVASVHVAWRPPAGGDPRLAALLTRLDG